MSGRATPRVILTFAKCTIVMNDDNTVTVSGAAFPRHLASAQRIFKDFIDCAGVDAAYERGEVNAVGRKIGAVLEHPDKTL